MLSRRPLLLLAALLVPMGACGAKTGLQVPDATFPDDVADVVDATDVADARDVPRCFPGRFELIPRAAEVMLVLDRSGSMNQPLAAGGRTSKWITLRNALGATLPRFASTLNVGALFYPEDNANDREAACVFANVPTVDVAPRLNATGAVLNVFDTTDTGGGTPTAAALRRAYTYFARNPSVTRSRSIVLATDGGPNCNAALNAATCTCTGGGGGGGGGRPSLGCRSDALRCLDDRATIETIQEIGANAVSSIPTYVIGLAGDNESTYAATLTAMAIAGGRPNRNAVGAPTFYDVRQPEELNAALGAIQATIARCTFLLPSAPRNDALLSIEVNGATVTRDPERRNGWDWTNRPIREITLFGGACPAAGPALNVSAVVACDDL